VEAGEADAVAGAGVASAPDNGWKKVATHSKATASGREGFFVSMGYWG
jgi:hypothetical protein